MNMKRYRFTLKHDHGKFRLSTVARDLQTAVRLICEAEGCPESAIISIKVGENARRSRRTP